MKSAISQALQIHWEQTGHNVQFKEVWTYTHNAQRAILGLPPVEDDYTVILRGATRFEAPHAILEINGERWEQALGPKPTSLSEVQREASYTVGKPKRIK